MLTSTWLSRADYGTFGLSTAARHQHRMLNISCDRNKTHVDKREIQRYSWGKWFLMFLPNTESKLTNHHLVHLYLILNQLTLRIFLNDWFEILLKSFGWIVPVFISISTTLILVFNKILLQASELCLVEGLRDQHRRRARLGLRRHKLLDDKHQDNSRHKTDVGRDVFDEDDGVELLVGAENGRYKVVAKAEPYKNLPVSKPTSHINFTVI